MKKVNLLSKAEMRNVMGGFAPLDPGCLISLYNRDGSGIIDEFLWVPSGSSCSAQSNSANNECVSWVSTVRGCRYNCNCDGWAS